MPWRPWRPGALISRPPFSTRMLVLLGVGALTTYIAFHHPGLGVAIGVGVDRDGPPP
ncbi:hypothetical protein [Streptomyces ossamyceticus]|uniref:Uncharacterized protein n=1 Tax=Streptomyces ossamyceticus TaxID=249581 RepID=A0ABV2V9G1_9ACTN